MGKVLKIREIGDPVLKNKSEEIDIENINKEILEIIEDLKSTLEYGTGLGISAPQIGINKRIIIPLNPKKLRIKKKISIFAPALGPVAQLDRATAF